MKFTSDEAFEAQEAGEPIMVSADAAQKIVADHDCDGWHTFIEDHGTNKDYDAAEVLGWLGY